MPFISYAREDEKWARKLAISLIYRGSFKKRTTITQQLRSSQIKLKCVSAYPDGSPKIRWADSIDIRIVTENSEYQLGHFLYGVRKFWEDVLEKEQIPHTKTTHTMATPFTS
ncbi:MAG: toll/interleukin-1 receptor domain-containing protein [Candidatus Thiodiazotropha sp. (ex Monitilora ramsayi)]|nr:toll/interleukin-1 receptor domain-containing protein [Candidatus Thiodiazotropha sp. (ex Monitilora ramsayi)]